MATVNIDGDASGAIAACAAAQGAIDALHGKTVNVDVNVRQSGGNGGMGAATQGMRDFGTAADRASRSTQGMGDHLGRSAGHMGRMADDAGRLRDHLAAVDNVLRGGAPSSIGRSGEGMRALAGHADTARQSISGIGAESSRSLGAAETGAIRAGDGMRQLGAGSGSASQFMAGMSGAAQQVSRDLVPMSQGADGVYRSVSRMAGAGKDVEKFAGAFKGIDAVGRIIDGGLGGGKGGGGGIPDFSGALGGFKGMGSALGELKGAAGAAAGAMSTLGLATVYSGIGMAALGAAVGAVGLAGVAEDFAHNTQLMHAGEQAVRGFNKEFSAMRSETTAAGLPAMNALATSMKGVGHELASIGAANIAPTLGMASQLAGSATTMMKKLEPVIGPVEQAFTSLAGAAMGALGNSGPEIARFANSITQNAGGLQSTMEGVVRIASTLGTFGVQTAAAAAPWINDAADVTSRVADFASGAMGINSNLSATPGPDGKVPAGPSAAARYGSAVTGAPVGHGLDLTTAAGVTAKLLTPVFGPVPGEILNHVASALSGPSGPVYGSPQRQAGTNPPQSYMDMAGAGGGRISGARQPSPDAARFSGMSAGDIMTQQRADAGLPPVGQPHYSGIGPRGPGQSVGPMPVNAAIGLGGGGIQPFNDMMSAANRQVASGGGATGTAMVQHIQKAVQTAAPAATAGGASLGAGMNSGMAQGSTSTQTVTDTVIVKHTKHLIEIAAAALGIHSPSTEFDYLGRMAWAGFGQGSERASAGTFGSMSSHMGGVLSAAQDQAAKFSPDYAGSSGSTVSVKKPNTDEAAGYDDYKNAVAARQDAADRKASFGTQQGMYQPGSEGWWSAHDNRAGQLAAGREDRQRSAIGGMTHDERRDQLLQNRANNRERALANLGVGGRTKPSGDVNPFAADQANAASRRQGLNAVINPFSQLPGMFNKAGENSVQGLSQGMTAHIPKIQAAGASVASAGHVGYKRKDQQSSPSAVWAGMGMNSAAGAASGLTGGTGMVVSAVGGMSDAMHAAGQQLSDRGLTVGYAWAENVNTGISTQIKKSNYQSLGLPTALGQAGLLGLAKTGLLSAGSGAQGYKTPGNAPGVVSLPAPQPVTIVMQPQHVVLDGQVIATITQQQFSGFLDQMTGAISLQSSA